MSRTRQTVSSGGGTGSAIGAGGYRDAVMLATAMQPGRAIGLHRRAAFLPAHAREKRGPEMSRNTPESCAMDELSNENEGREGLEISRQTRPST